MSTETESNTFTVQGLGPKWPAEDVASLFEVEPSTVKRYPVDFGGVRVRNRWLFFENLIEQAVRNTHAQQTSAPRQDLVDRPSRKDGLPEREPLQDQDRSQTMGKRSKSRLCGSRRASPLLEPFDAPSALRHAVGEHPRALLPTSQGDLSLKHQQESRLP